jgi:hypothetical protein
VSSGVDGERGARRELQLAPDIRQVPMNGVLAYVQARRDLLVTQAVRNQAEHLELTLREPGGRGSARRSSLLSRPLDSGQGLVERQ